MHVKKVLVVLFVGLLVTILKGPQDLKIGFFLSNLLSLETRKKKKQEVQAC